MERTTRRGFIQKMFLSADRGAADREPHALVVVFLRGGADTLNLVVPYGDDAYYRARPTIALAPPSSGGLLTSSALRLDDFYGLHPLLAPLLPVFNEGRLGIVQAVGSDNTTGSHFEAQDQMERGEGYHQTIGGGWLGRFLRGRKREETAPLRAVAIGPSIPESLRGSPSASALRDIDELQLKTPSGDTSALSAALSAMYGAEAGVLSQPGRVTIDLLRRVESLRTQPYRPEEGAAYADDSFSAGLREIARLIKAGVGLEVACLDLDGWDTHFFQGTTGGAQATSIDQLGRALAAFDADLKSFRDRFTVIVMTEFGRRIYENGSLGTDHGRGFAFMAIGNHIDGGKIHGEWPGLVETEEDLLGPGGLRVKIDYRSVLWEVLSACMNCRNLKTVFPGFHAEPVGLVRSP
ncbi:MAG TPA: DUF1501 domain-containing protein [Blastocatellia bacterium]|nr:DUF1501 domain-containing protein [Blastocatellia bacterium]